MLEETRRQPAALERTLEQSARGITRLRRQFEAARPRLDESFPAFVYGPAGATWPSIHNVLDRLETLKADTLLITDRGNPAALRNPRVLELPAQPGPRNGMADLYAAIPYIVPAQLFAAHLAAIKGLDPDRPRTLKKITRTM